ncbi:SigB/SigF/SigG family RNA polymerase sigma factor [Streptomyces sp. WAC06614]|uniref:SigB/SigF/SigG family RNA polymerase sigma factor n=1 Tax=Streptomyces sp. WAC06614 TaxID=2487416 RepID=UPI000F77CA63|nr:SigB/SigF/SigG family RNA polymerase sigma factor [Streptomyces sp. WAC06614]RSS79284.1 SigB/SigF/SigG family RNA polymerase sigma factor [Streptomyces sp. WAC06614]
MTTTATESNTTKATTPHTTTATPTPPRTDEVPDCPRDVTTRDARRLTPLLLERLHSLERGTREYQYVRNTLIEMNLSLVRFAVRPYRDRPGGPELDDLIQVGTIGLIKAIDRFDPGRNTQFTTLALPFISGEIKRHFRDTAWAVRVPRRLQELRSELVRAAEELASVLGTEPTPADLAEHLGLTEDEVREGLVAANGYSARSIDAQAGPGDGAEAGGSGRSPGGRRAPTLADSVGEVDPGLEAVENRHALAPLLSGLDERRSRILRMRFVEERTQREIGEEIGVSQMQVSRILSRTLSELRKGMLGDG